MNLQRFAREGETLKKKDSLIIYEKTKEKD